MKQSKFLHVALDAVKKAEEVILRYYHHGVGIEVKDDNSPVTVADKEAEKIIIRTIKEKFPEHRFLGEESGDSEGQSEYVWIIDPIDGTISFGRGVPIFTTEIALMYNNEIILGVSNVPMLQSLVCAEKGTGSYHNGKRIHVSRVTSLKEAYISYGGSMNTRTLVPKVLRILQAARSSVSGLHAWAHHLVAAGKLECALHGAANIWDVAAGVIIVQEAGGRCSDLYGNKITWESKSFLLSNDILHDRILEYFKQS